MRPVMHTLLSRVYREFDTCVLPYAASQSQLARASGLCPPLTKVGI